MGKEIERKFLIKKEDWSELKKPLGEKYKQGYLLISPEKTIRIRKTESSGYITIKGKTQGATRPEYEYAIPTEDVDDLLVHFCENLVEKTRYKITFKGHLWEVDEFKNTNQGLIMAEIELKDEAEEFELPSWIEKEVTGDLRYYNSYLAEHPFSTWQERV